MELVVIIFGVLGVMTFMLSLFIHFDHKQCKKDVERLDRKTGSLQGQIYTLIEANNKLVGDIRDLELTN